MNDAGQRGNVARVAEIAREIEAGTEARTKSGEFLPTKVKTRCEMLLMIGALDWERKSLLVIVRLKKHSPRNQS